MPPIRKGVLSKAEKAFIDKHFRKRSTEDMALELNRSVDIVRRYVLEQGGQDPNGGLLTTLRSRPEWAKFQLEFTADELEVFEYLYVKLMRQFDESEMLATEEIQVFDFIRCEITMTRNLREQKKLHDEMAAVAAQQEELQRALKRPSLKADAKRAAMSDLKDLGEAYNKMALALKEVQGRYNSGEARKSQLLKELKGTRDQRVKQIEGSKHSYIGLLKALMQDDFRHGEEQYLHLMQAAADKERRRLAAPHKYLDGQVDQPLLTPTTVTGDEAATEESGGDEESGTDSV